MYCMYYIYISVIDKERGLCKQHQRQIKTEGGGKSEDEGEIDKALGGLVALCRTFKINNKKKRREGLISGKVTWR